MKASFQRASKVHLRQSRYPQKLLTFAFSGLLLLFFSIPSMAQNNIRVKGRVADETGRGVARASISVKGGTTGTTADDNGNYEISAPSNGTLVISAINFTTQEVRINGRPTLNIDLVSTERTESEVVVIGYGTQRKKDVTGSTVSVKGETLNDFRKRTSILRFTRKGLQEIAADVVFLANKEGLTGHAASVEMRANDNGPAARPKPKPDKVVAGGVAPAPKAAPMPVKATAKK